MSVLGIGGRGKREDIDVGAQVAQAFLLAHAESVFLVDDHESQVGELDAGGQQPVRADGDIDGAARQPFADVLRFAVGPQAGDDFDFGRPVREAVAERLVVLLGQQRRRRQYGNLLAGLDGDEGGAHGDLGLAEADIPADQAVGGPVGPEIGQYRVDGALLVGRRLERELFAEAVIVVVRGAEDGAGARFPPRVDVEQFSGHVVDLPGGPPLRLVPLIGAEAVQRRLVAVGAGVTGNQVQRGDGDVEAALFGVVDGEKLLRIAVYLEGPQAAIAADAVVGMHDGRADGQLGQVADDEFGVEGPRCTRSGPVGAVAEDLRFGDQREVRQQRTAVDVRDRERKRGTAIDKRLEVVHLHHVDARAGKELREVLPSPGRFGGQQHRTFGRVDELTQIARFIPSALARHHVRKPAAAEVDAVPGSISVRVHPEPRVGGQRGQQLFFREVQRPR